MILRFVSIGVNSLSADSFDSVDSLFPGQDLWRRLIL
jgi:hypothetical protein